ncbi:219_t:CDS:2, partial [Ambispora leptoticha]
MSWDSYFDETPPKEYRFLGFYKYRQEKDDFTFSFQKEANRLRKSLDLLVKNEQYERLPVVLRKGKTHTTTVGILRVTHLMVLRV